MAEKQERETQMTISGVPESLLEAIDEIATADRRSRSQEVVILLEEIVAMKTKEVAA